MTPSATPAAAFARRVDALDEAIDARADAARRLAIGQRALDTLTESLRAWDALALTSPDAQSARQYAHVYRETVAAAVGTLAAAHDAAWTEWALARDQALSTSLSLWTEACQAARDDPRTGSLEAALALMSQLATLLKEDA